MTPLDVKKFEDDLHKLFESHGIIDRLCPLTISIGESNAVCNPRYWHSVEMTLNFEVKEGEASLLSSNLLPS